MMWEEQDQTDQRKSVNKQDNLCFREETRQSLFQRRNKRQNLSNCQEYYHKLTFSIKRKASEENLFKEEEEHGYKLSAIKQLNTYLLKLQHNVTPHSLLTTVNNLPASYKNMMGNTKNHNC